MLSMFPKCRRIALAFLLCACPAFARDSAPADLPQDAPPGVAPGEEADPVLRELEGLRHEVAELKEMILDLQDALANAQGLAAAPRFAPRVPGADYAAPDAQTTPVTENLPGGRAPSREKPLPPVEVMPQEAPGGPPPAATQAAEKKPAGPVAASSFAIVREWGRTPDEAKNLTKDATSLKGMVLVVPQGAPQASVEQLGRDLRTQYAAYDNINIEVFDERDAAEQYLKSNVGNPAHRVLSVSKHKASGRDVVLSIHDGMTLEVK